MTKIAIIGTQGMLGSAVCRFLSEKDYQILEINRSGKSSGGNPVIKFDIRKNKINELHENLKHIDFVLNCAGLIKHKIDQDNKESLDDLIRVNSLFPIQLSALADDIDFKVVQVATDCVYSGRTGNYSESDTKDPTDYYGYSKAVGEHSSDNLLTIRCSLIGRELKSKFEFLEWVLGHTTGSTIRGFTNHRWNGLTTLHFAKIVNGVINNKNFRSGTFHVIPTDSTSKFELARLLIESFGVNGVNVSRDKSPMAVNRVLTTNYQEISNEMWRNAGYNSALSISEMVKEYALWA